MSHTNMPGELYEKLVQMKYPPCKNGHKRTVLNTWWSNVGRCLCCKDCEKMRALEKKRQQEQAKLESWMERMI